MDFIRNEPAIFMGLIQVAIAAIMNLLIVFQLELSAEQVAAVNGVVMAVLAVVLSIWTRAKVTPVAKP